MKRYAIFFMLSLLASCQFMDENINYRAITNENFRKLKVLDTLTDNHKVTALTVSSSASGLYPQLLIKTKRSDDTKYYLFDEAELENDSIVLSYGNAFEYVEGNGFRENGIWVYTKFYKEGVFPFTTSVMEYSVDSIPSNWKNKVPTKEGIYFYEDNSLRLISKEQSEKKFKEANKTGFYFFPNKGRLFDRININQL